MKQNTLSEMYAKYKVEMDHQHQLEQELQQSRQASGNISQQMALLQAAIDTLNQRNSEFIAAGVANQRVEMMQQDRRNQQLLAQNWQAADQALYARNANMAEQMQTVMGRVIQENGRRKSIK